jgi:hypothetical protein
MSLYVSLLIKRAGLSSLSWAATDPKSVGGLLQLITNRGDSRIRLCTAHCEVTADYDRIRGDIRDEEDPYHALSFVPD